MKAVFIVLIFFSGVVIGGTVFTVNSIGDSPDASLNNNCYTGSTIGGQPECTLRAAIQESNNTSGASIDFNITQGCGANNICTINIDTQTAALPEITSQVFIDGLTQPGNTSLCNLYIPNRSSYHVVIQGDLIASAPGLKLATGSDGSVIKGLNIRSFSNNLEIYNSSNNQIQCNFIGTDETGMISWSNNWANGIYVSCAAQNNIIGGVSQNHGNLISGNYSNGILFKGDVPACPGGNNETKFNSVAGNFIGTLKDGTSDGGNFGSGIAFLGESSGYSWIGDINGNNSISPNVISENATGIRIYFSDNNEILGNFIGTDLTGTEKLGNTNSGIEIEHGSNNRIGDADSASYINTIAYNENGVMLTGALAANNIIERNSMYGNRNLAIELIRDNSTNNDGQNPNDTDDADSGANLLINSAEILDYQTSYDEFLMTYILEITASIDASDTNAAYPLWITFYSTDVSESMQGRKYLGGQAIMTPAATHNLLHFYQTSDYDDGMHVAMTVTDANSNTSEMSQPVTIGEFDLIFANGFDY